MNTITGKLLMLTRAKDWRLSFVPFIVGCVYLWLWWFNIRFSISSLVVFALSFITTVGFAALGYFINEFFDKEVDRKAGKANMLASLPVIYQATLLVVCLLLTFLPWLWLPTSKVSWGLIFGEIFLFLIYSLPFPRLKNFPPVSGFIDAGYAYVQPLLLSFYTYSLFANSTDYSIVYLLMLTVFVIGYRNITIHHVNDVFKDMTSGTMTLPQKLGVKNTNRLLFGLLIIEILLMVIWGTVVSCSKPLFAVWIIVFLLFLYLRYRQIAQNFQFQYFSILPVRHLTDPAYQYVFPGFALLLAATADYQWLLLIPFHFLILLTKPMQIIAWETVYWKCIQLKYAAIRFFTWVIVIPTSLIVNYFIFFVFLLAGVNLRKEKKSAYTYLRHKFGKEK
ncbi:MAG: UbiA family prenyltransferase [Chitinophagales bacterium]|nr:UbiA family prenyltransferase [Chitinophagales bacterium]